MSSKVVSQVWSKRKRGLATAENEEDQPETTKRGSRSKNMKQPNARASWPGTRSAKKQGKKLSTKRMAKVTIIPMDDRVDDDHGMVVFISTIIHRRLYYLSTAKQKSLRDNIGPDVLGSFVDPKEAAAINLVNNHRLFPTLVTSKGFLRSKDNFTAATQATREGGVFTTGIAKGKASGATASDIKAEDLAHRAAAMRVKATALNKQAQVYEKAAQEIKETQDITAVEVDLESAQSQAGMTYIADALPVKRADLCRYINAHEDHLMATAERLRGDMAVLAAYVQKAEKRLRDLIQLKVAADLKICRDIKKFGKFEVQAWQMGALPTTMHLCQCAKCRQESELAPETTNYRYPDEEIANVTREDALPYIKLEDDSENENGAGTNEAPAGATPGIVNSVSEDEDDLPAKRAVPA